VRRQGSFLGGLAVLRSKPLEKCGEASKLFNKFRKMLLIIIIIIIIIAALS
jgi:hypothetical protein